MKIEIEKKTTLAFYLLGVFVIYLQLQVLGYEILLKSNPGLSFISYGMRSIIDGAILMLPYWILPPKYRKLIWIVIGLFTVWAISQMWYFRTYRDLMPFSSYLLFENVNGLLLQSIKGSVRFIDVWVVAFPVALYACYRRFFKIKIEQEKMGWKYSLAVICIVVIPSLAFCLVQSVVYFYKENGRTTDSLFGRYTSSLGKVSYLDKCGLVPYLAYTVAEDINDMRALSSEERENIDKYIREDTPHYSDNAFSVKQRRNLILIIVESLNAWAVNIDVDGRPVTPVLNSLCERDSAIVALRMQPQVRNGRSSDAHFMYNTGLLPIQSGATSVEYGKANYPSVAKALRKYGYNSFIVTCDNKSFWNQEQTRESYGFGRLYDNHDVNEHSEIEKVGLDRAMFKKSLSVIGEMEQPFYAQLITLTMHQPYDSPKVKPTWISRSKQYSSQVKNYLETVHYFDSALGDFLAALKRIGRYDNSVIVIASDHDEMDKNQADNREDVQSEDRNTVFLVLNAGRALKYTDIMGQIDVYPTLLDVMGANEYGWKGLGHSLLRMKPTGKYAVPDEAWKMSNLMITKHYFGK